jgi:hypothetical protein
MVLYLLLGSGSGEELFLSLLKCKSTKKSLLQDWLVKFDDSSSAQA